MGAQGSKCFEVKLQEVVGTGRARLLFLMVYYASYIDLDYTVKVMLLKYRPKHVIFNDIYISNKQFILNKTFLMMLI